MGVRVYELAKEFGISSKELVLKLKQLHVTVKGHMSAIDDDTAELVRHEFTPSHTKKVKVPKEEVKKVVKKELEKEIKEIKKEEIKPEIRIIVGKVPMSVKELSAKMQINPAEIIKKLINLKIMATVNQSLDKDVLEIICLEFGCNFEKELNAEEKLLVKHIHSDDKARHPRPAVVTLMGHVDHGKTSLLDVIRKSNLTNKESGGITQHIGAYEVMLEKGSITFLDTPGHQAFTAMRARGANITDIVIIVVAADDGIMPQTIEAINHAKAAQVPIIVAINKMDVRGADIDNVKRQLAEIGLTPEEWGGKTMAIPVSAKEGTGIDHLLDMIILESEMLELKANEDDLARGAIIESKLSKGSGPTATILVQNGTLRIGDIFVCGNTFGKVRSMVNDAGQRVEQAGPSVPVEISGLSQVPQVGDEFFAVEDERKAKEICINKHEALRRERLMPAQRATLEQIFEQSQSGKIKELCLIIKADVQGSLEALITSLQDLSTDDIRVRIIHSQVGNINESDVMLAIASKAIILGFHVGVELNANETAEKKGVDIRLYRIIYEAINEVRLSMEGLLDPTIRETFLGRAKVLQIFKVSKVGKIAGSTVVKGKFVRNAELVRVFRGEQCVFEGKLDSLKRYKDDVKEVGEGLECGIGIDKFSSIESDDMIECYRVEKIARKL
ncbi:MAG: translation initiation factor IF-2 [Candidatus Omnitrophica bacterium]|nr:translation initiation factor IF-2 [Candidatus Omnitrophota bacterium]